VATESSESDTSGDVSRFVQLADHGTDAVAIVALAVLGLYADPAPSWELVGTIASVAVGKNYLRSRGS